MPFTNAGKHIMLDALAADCDFISLHDDDPGGSGDNELSGGSPAYARKEPVFAASSSGEKALNAALEFDIPPGSTVAYVGFWKDDTVDVFLGSAELESPEEYTGQGTYTLNTSTKLKISDPA